MSEIKAFLFDLGGVLVHVDSSESITNLARDLGIDEPTFRGGMTPELLRAYEKGFISSSDFYLQLLKNCGAEGRLDIDSFRAYWQDVLFPNDIMIAQLEQIVCHYPVWFLSNTNDYHYELMMEKFPFMKLAKGGVYSFMVGAVKPEPAIYQLACEMTGYSAEELLFIDDLSVNIEGARRQGLNCVQFDSHSKFCNSMETEYPRTWEKICD